MKKYTTPRKMSDDEDKKGSSSGIRAVRFGVQEELILKSGRFSEWEPLAEMLFKKERAWSHMVKAPLQPVVPLLAGTSAAVVKKVEKELADWHEKESHARLLLNFHVEKPLRRMLKGLSASEMWTKMKDHSETKSAAAMVKSMDNFSAFKQKKGDTRVSMETRFMDLYDAAIDSGCEISDEKAAIQLVRHSLRELDFVKTLVLASDNVPKIEALFDTIENALRLSPWTKRRVSGAEPESGQMRPIMSGQGKKRLRKRGKRRGRNCCRRG